MGAPGRRCLLCRSSCSPAGGKSLPKSCGVSLCNIFGLSDKHPFRVIFDKAGYCSLCRKEVEQADLIVGRLEIIKQSLLRFQHQFYSSLGENYFKINNRDGLDVNYQLFEAGEEALTGRKFSYDEVVKVIYEKLDKDCSKWESFSSRDITPTPSPPPPPETSSSWTQTEPEEPPPPPDPPAPLHTQIVICHESPVWDHSVQEEVVLDSGPPAPSLPENVSCSPPDELPLFLKPRVDFSEKILCPYDNCSRYFYDSYNLSVHLRSYHEKNPLPHECPVCNRGFVDESRLKNHYHRVHSRASSFLCDHCGQGFPSKLTLRDHIRKKHNSVPNNQLFVCSVCSYSNSNGAHESLHADTPTPFSCVVCSPPTSFPNSTLLRAHVTEKHQPERVPCTKCNKSFANATSLRGHMKTHSGDFVCNQCPIKSTTVTALRLHQLSHTGEEPFTCDVCGHGFRYQKNLTSHMRIHTGEKPYSCSVCGQAFRELSFLKRHEESHSSVDNYQCNDCGKGFKVKESLNKHRKTHSDGYVPPKKPYRPRTELQKMQRRLKRAKADVVVNRKSDKPRKKKTKKKKIEVRAVTPKPEVSQQQQIITAVKSIGGTAIFEGQLIPVQVVTTTTAQLTAGSDTKEDAKQTEIVLQECTEYQIL